jgi:hypothetical protein
MSFRTSKSRQIQANHLFNSLSKPPTLFRVNPKIAFFKMEAQLSFERAMDYIGGDLLSYIGASIFVASFALTLASHFVPKWLIYSSDPPEAIKILYGLTKRCSSVTKSCRPFPDIQDCASSLENRSFCNMWKTSRWASDLTIVLSLICLAAYVIIIFGDGKKKKSGYRILAFILLLIGNFWLIDAHLACTQIVPLALVLHIYKSDIRFDAFWSLGPSWILAVVSCAIQVC